MSYTLPMIRTLSLAVLALALAACGPKPEATSAAPARPREAALLVTPAAIGRATTATPFDRNTVQRLFSDSDVSLEFREAAGVRMPVIVVRGPGDLLVELRDKAGTLDSAAITGDGVRGPRGERIGESLAVLGFTAPDCSAPVDNQVTCHRKGQPQLGFVFPVATPEAPLRAFDWQAD